MNRDFKREWKISVSCISSPSYKTVKVLDTGCMWMVF